MSSVTIIAVVEGKTEKAFIDEILAPALGNREIYMSATILGKPGKKGGNVKFDRVKKDVGNHLKQRSDTYVTMLVDFYGINPQWPNLSTAKTKQTPQNKAEYFTENLLEKICESFPEHRPEVRFIPYVAMHEFESMLFSNPQILADAIRVDVSLSHTTHDFRLTFC